MPLLVFDLFVTGSTRQSLAAVQNLRAYFAEFPDLDYELSIIDVLEQPERAEECRILATPTLVRRLPLPSLRIIGDLSEKAVVWQTIGLLSSRGPRPHDHPNDEDADHDR